MGNHARVLSRACCYPPGGTRRCAPSEMKLQPSEETFVSSSIDVRHPSLARPVRQQDRTGCHRTRQRHRCRPGHPAHRVGAPGGCPVLGPPMACWPAPHGVCRAEMEATERRRHGGRIAAPPMRRPSACPPHADTTARGWRLGPVVRATWHAICTSGSKATCAQRLARFDQRATAASHARGIWPRHGTRLPNHGHDTGDDDASHRSPPRCSSGGLPAALHAPPGIYRRAGPARRCLSPHRLHRGAAHCTGRNHPCPSRGQNTPPAPCHHDAPLPGRHTPPSADRSARIDAGAGALVARSGSLPRRPALAGEPAQPTAGLMCCVLPVGAALPSLAPRPDP
jgi:hypothetical protein